MPKKQHDPMLRKMISQEQRAIELKLLAEYEASGKIRRIDYVSPELDDDGEVTEYEFQRTEDKSSLGDGNFRRWHRTSE